MKKALLIATLLLGCCWAARAQVVVISGGSFSGQLSTLNVEVLDSLTREPIPFASVYVIPRRDTTITNFTLTDAEGKAKLEEVPYGNYTFFVEMLGYKTVRKVRNIHDWRVDMGRILLQEDPQYIEAATVSDVGNPITVKRDTIEFNAASYRVGSNAVLRDLVKRMPGIEITSEGTVKMNGQPIDKITLGGRTFFFDDQAMALNNLPAQMVDKIRIIDRDSEQKRATGIDDGQREKIMDVVVKKEYEKGWFGNLGLKAGSTIAAGKEGEPLRDDRGLLYNGNGMLSGYTEKDQVTLIANGGNVVDDSDGVVVVYAVGDGEGLDLSNLPDLATGITTQAQLGVNANTSRIKDTETTAMVNYNYQDNLGGNRTYRTTFQDSGNLLGETTADSHSFGGTFRTSLEFKKEKGKLWFNITPAFSYSNNQGFSGGTSSTADESGAVLNRSERSSHSLSHNAQGSLNSSFTLREIGGNPRRSLRLSLQGSYGGGTGSSEESSSTLFGGAPLLKDIGYANRQASANASVGLVYAEPLGEKLVLTVNPTFAYRFSDNNRDADDRITHRDDYYSSYSRVRYLTYGLSSHVQYNYTQGASLTAGFTGNLQEQVTHSRSYGTQVDAGEGEWLLNLGPRISWNYYKNNTNAFVSASSNTNRPSQTLLLPTLNVADPTRLSTGNIYLKPSFSISPIASWNYSNPQRMSSLFMQVYGSFVQRSTTYARWYDKEGVMSSVPVNAKTPSLNLSLSGGYSFPLDREKVWTLSLNGSGSYSQGASFRATGTAEALSRENFDYYAFMADFWGNGSGDRFYGGDSGFQEQITRRVSGSLGGYVRLNLERFHGYFRVNTSPSYSSVTQYTGESPFTVDSRLGLEMQYNTVSEFEFSTDLTYRFYHGYAPGYGDPEWQWNFSVNKSIGAFVLSFSVHDILNQTKNLHRSTSANYVEDSYSLVMGRYGLFGVKWNFGKMNAAQSRRARSASFNMIL